MLRWPFFLPFFALACSEYEVTNLTTEDSFTQTEEPPADVLFVVDDSASMAEEQQNLAANFGAFLELLGDTTADFRLGVTTTDPARGGVLVGAVLTPDSPDAVDTFAAQVAVGTSGARDEQGLAMGVRGLREDVNPDFLREDGFAHVVFVSDEDDHSEGSVESYLTALKAAAIGEGVTVHAVVGDIPAGCMSGSSAADAGTRYLEVASALEGLHESICADDYAEVLQALGLAVSGWNPVFPLSELAAEATLTVWVEGVKMPRREEDGWTYSIGENAIIFTGHAIPRPGMKVRVTYQRGT